MRTKVLSLAALAIAGLMSHSQAQTYPTRAITIITTGAAGSVSDIMPRQVAEDLSKRLGKPVVVDNRPGGTGLVAANMVLAAPADGYTVWFGPMGTLAVNPHILKSMPFDPDTAFIPVALVGSTPLVMVVNPKQVAAKTLEQFIAEAKSQPDRFAYGSVGPGSTPAIAAAILSKRAGITMTHVPYRGFGPALDAVIKGEVAMMMSDTGPVLQRLADGSLRALAVTTPKRTTFAPDVPTFKEQNIDLDISLWYGLFLRAGTPAEVSDRLAREMGEVLKDPAFAKSWSSMGIEAGTLAGPEFVRYFKSEQEKWAKVVPTLGIPRE